MVLIIGELSTQIIITLIITGFGLFVFLIKSFLYRKMENFFKKIFNDSLRNILEEPISDLQKFQNSVTESWEDFEGLNNALEEMKNDLTSKSLELKKELVDTTDSICRKERELQSIVSKISDRTNELEESRLERLTQEAYMFMDFARKEVESLKNIKINADVSEIKKAIIQMQNELAGKLEKNVLGEISKTTKKIKMQTGQILEKFPEPNEPPPDPTGHIEFLPLRFEFRRPSINKRKWRSFAFYNYKGGVGKTTLAFNIGHDLAMRKEKKVLLIDIDPQANLSFLTLEHEDYSRTYQNVPTLLHKFYNENKEQLNIRKWAAKSSEYISHIDIIPNQPSQMQIEESLIHWYCAGKDVRDIWIKLLASEQNHYDYIIFDCPPNMGFMSQAALVACDAVFVPATPSRLIRDSIRYLRSGIKEWRGLLEENHSKVVDGLILNNFPWKNDNFTKFAEQEIKNYKGNSLFKKVIFPDVIPTAPGSTVLDRNKPLSLGPIAHTSMQQTATIKAFQKTTNTIIKRLDNISLKESNND